MLQRRLLWVFGGLVLIVAAIGAFSLQATTGTSRDFGYLIDHTVPTLHTLSHLKAATARLMLEAERLGAQGGTTQTVAFEHAQSSFEEALAEYEVVATLDDNGVHLARHIGDIGSEVLSQAGALQESIGTADRTQQDAGLNALRNNEQQLTRYLEEAINLESGELQQGDASADHAAEGRRQTVILVTGGTLFLAITFGTFLIRQAGIEEEVQVRLQTAKTQTEAALVQSEERFRVAAEGALVGIYIIGDDKLRYVNPVMAHLFGYEPEELIETVTPLELVHPEDRCGVAERMQRRLSGIAANAPISSGGSAAMVEN